MVAFVAALLAVPISDGTAHALVPPCGDPKTPIHDLQGNGAATPIPGATVNIDGIVTVGVPGTGFFVQEAAADVDADPRTSEGMLVLSASAQPAAVGDVVRVTGVVDEFQPAGARGSRTQLTPVTVTVCASGVSVTPSNFDLPVGSSDEWEPYEGMLVLIDQPLTVTGTAGLGPADEVDLAVAGRLAKSHQHRRARRVSG